MKYQMALMKQIFLTPTLNPLVKISHRNTLYLMILICCTTYIEFLPPHKLWS